MNSNVDILSLGLFGSLIFRVKNDEYDGMNLATLARPPNEPFGPVSTKQAASYRYRGSLWSPPLLIVYRSQPARE